VQSRHRKASPNRLHDVSNFLKMQAQDTAYSVSGRIKVVVISGPTAVGKSALAESIAKSLAGK
jgi:cytidylate kinase